MLSALLLFQSSLPVASSQGRVFFSCLPGQGVNRPTLVASWEGKLGAAWLEACPALVTCPGICARPPPEAVRHSSCLVGALPLGACPAGPRAGSTVALGCGIGPSPLLHPFSCPSLVIDAQLWFESLSPSKKMNRKGETDTLIKGTA